ncbi:haloacid dehalogenase type II [Curtobacterium sp. MCBD17_034]|uniref:haloacid dehalogenase type II n=1 Tax=unclassified Curtobacterium TaxID=257496 RepID=UPI000DA7FAE0|nr:MULTISPECIES: haloacid dehalogenase type II [unclassified Curtobacterium]PZF61147.1 haloacid dehalogenase type II [Curtobacterium sp. MCBD17_034]PZM40496.1 haloacid dehalogenase type II [Curtobacterium sp. MCBD17_031]
MTDHGTGVDALLVDTIGTVVDDVGTIRDRLAVALAAHAGHDVDAIARRWDDLMDAAMAAVNAGEAPWRPHRAIRRESLDDLVADGSLPALSADEHDELVDVTETLRPWPDSADALATLGRQVVVASLSNADLDELAALSQRAGLRWHAVVSAQFPRAFKPAASVYRTALELLGVPAARTMMVAAHPWDLRAAASLGMQTAYVARPSADAPAPDDRFTIAVRDLADLGDRLPTLTHRPD